MTDRRQQIDQLRAQLADLEAAERQAAAPPSVEPPQPKRIGPAYFGLAVVGIVGAAVVGYSIISPDEAPSAPAIETQVAPTPAPALPPASPWRYTTTIDPITDRKTRLACTTSANAARLQPPYSDVHAELCLRDDPRHGRDAFVALLGDGQMLYRSYDDSPVVVRFDDGPAQSFAGAGAADGSPEVVFFRAARRFEAGVKEADITLIELNFYRAGVQILRFPTDDFAWPTE